MKGLSIGATVAWQAAASEAASGGHEFISRELILIGICSLDKWLRSDGAGCQPQACEALLAECNAVAEAMHSCGLDATKLRRLVREKCGQGNYKPASRVVHRDEGCKATFRRAEDLVGPGGDATCLHLLAALMGDPGHIVGQILEAAHVQPAHLRNTAQALTAALVPARSPAASPVVVTGGTPHLDRYGRDLTEAARAGTLGPFVGRRKELLQVVQTLARHSKNNPLLVGEAGVGKTAIVEALAVRVAQSKDWQVLSDRRIVELNMGSLVAGAKYRGEFEERFEHILSEARTHPEIILFIDELHTVVGAGRAEGSMDAANLLKPALARGELRCIGATTIAEYRRYIESDAALERRFEKIIVAEPNPEETLEILRGIRPRWEEHHGIHITEDVLLAAVALSIRFDGDHRLPDKAIDLVDRAGARTRLPALSIDLAVGDGTGSPIAASAGHGWPVVTGLTIAEVLAEKTGLPLDIVTGHLEAKGRHRLDDLRPYLKSHLVGQQAAVEVVCRRLLLAHSRLVQRRGPLAVFLFVGPTGVGKTEMARLLARFLFGTESAMIRLDMSEYQEPHSVARLIGAPPGYVGYESEGQLTGALRTRPYCVVLLDEIEKAHSNVYDLFLQVFDDGRLTDAKGRTVNASNAIFIMTSNLLTTTKLGFGQHRSDKSSAALLDVLRKSFRAEFVNRIDEVVMFRSLAMGDIEQILGAMIEEVCGTLQQQHGITLDVALEAHKVLAQAGNSSTYGARELRRTVERLLQAPLSELLASGHLQNHPNWRVVPGDGGLVIFPYTPGRDTS